MDVDEINLSQPKTYFDLIIKVGSKGPYQRNIFIIMMINWFIGAFNLLGTSLLYLNPKFDCQANGIEINSCEQFVCNNIPEQNWHKYVGTR